MIKLHICNSGYGTNAKTKRKCMMETKLGKRIYEICVKMYAVGCFQLFSFFSFRDSFRIFLVTNLATVNKLSVENKRRLDQSVISHFLSRSLLTNCTYTLKHLFALKLCLTRPACNRWIAYCLASSVG